MRFLGKNKKWAYAMATLLAAYVFLHYSFWYHTISGTVVDADNGKPIEGAVALCVWTVTYVLIEHTHSVAKVSEAVSDSAGRIRISGTWNIFADEPELTIYKRGYVAWNNNALFRIPEEDRKRLDGVPDTEQIVRLTEMRRRKDFLWKSGFVAKLEKWKDGYSFIEHESFVSMHALSQTRNFIAAYEWETDHRVQERDLRNELRDRERRR